MTRTILTTALLLFPGALAAADLIVFDNTAGTFQWTAELYDGSVLGPGKVHLDITRAPDDQKGAYTSSTAWMVHYPAEATPHWDRLQVIGGIGIARGPLQTFFDEEGDPLSLHFARSYGNGSTVGPDADFTSPHSNAHLRLLNSYTSPAINEWFPESRFLGMSFMLEGNVHYGWIQIAWNQGLDDDPQPLRWGYETMPGMPALVIPAPAGTLLLAFLLPACGRRCRRRSTT